MPESEYSDTFLDLADVRAMIDRRLVTASLLWEHFLRIEPQLYRFPAISPTAFRRALESAVGPTPAP